MKVRLSSSVLLAIGLLGSPAVAREYVRAGVRHKKGPERVNSRKLRPHAALTEFAVGYEAGSDHNMHALVVRGGNGSARFELADKQGRRQRSTYKAEARWLQSDALRGRTTTLRKRCRVRCLIPLPRTDGRWVLSGFSLRRLGHKDDHVLRIAVKMDSSRRNLEVVFRDRGRHVDFDVIADLVSVPKALIGGTQSPKGHARGEKGSKSVSLGRPRRGETPVIAGFDVRFLNSDHKFRLLSVKPCGRRATRCVTFWDARPDDPFEAELQLVYLRPETRRRRRR